MNYMIDEELSLCNEAFNNMKNYDYGCSKYIEYFMSAFSHCVNAANMGDIGSCYTAGMIYFEGREVPRNYDSAFKYFSFVYDNGVKDIIPILGYCYMRGLGTSINYDKAIELFSSIDDTYNVDICMRLKDNCDIRVIKNMSELKEI